MIDYKLDMPVALAVNMCCVAASHIDDRDSSFKKDNKDEHAYIPSPVHFIQTVLKVLEVEGIKQDQRILDLGCGVSSILAYLSLKGFTNLVGVDNDPLMVNGMSTICRAEEGDLTDMDDELIGEISEADVVYMYAPVAHVAGYKDVVKEVAEHMSGGSIIISIYGPTGEIFSNIEGFKECIGEMDYGRALYYKKEE